MVVLLPVTVAGAAETQPINYIPTATKTIPQLSTNNYTVTVQQSSSSVVAGETLTVTATVVWRSNGTPASGVRVAFDADKPAGAFSPTAAITDENGEVSVSFKSSEAGLYVITAQSYWYYPKYATKTFDYSKYEDDSGTGTVSVTAPTPVAQFKVDKTSGPAPLTVQFSDISSGATSWSWNFGDGSMSSSQNPSYTYGTPGTYLVRLTVTNSAGSSVPAEETITVEAPSSGGSGSTSTVTPTPVVTPDAGIGTTVSPTPGAGSGGTPTASSAGTDSILAILSDNACCIIAGVIVLLILLVVLAYLWMKTNLRIEPKKTRVPADGISKLPIRVQFVNGLGMVKKLGRDTDVDFETTAGTIKSAVVPQGKDHIDAELTSSKEFGPVAVTARALGKTVSTRVDFTLEQGTLDVTVQPETIPADGTSSATVTVKIKDDKGNFVAPLEDKTITLKSTLGTIAPSVKLPARTQSASTNITSGETNGTAVIIATLGNMHGEGKLELKGMPKRFCMHCGMPMSLEASQCPKCGQTPPSGTDVKQCPACSTVIPEAAKFCYHCGSRQPENK